MLDQKVFIKGQHYQVPKIWGTNSLGMKYMMLRGKWIKPCVDEEHQLKTTSCLKIIFSRGGEGGVI